MENLIEKIKEIYAYSGEAAATKHSVREMLNELIEDNTPIPQKTKVVVKKDGSQFTAKDNNVWEYEADPDYLTTVTL